MTETTMNDTRITPPSRPSRSTGSRRFARRDPLRPARSAATAALGALALLAAAPAAAAPETYRIDPEHLSIGFLVHHIGYADTLGMFREAEGSFVFDPEARTLEDLTVTIQAESVFTNHQRRDDHLRGDDFLDVEAHPEITFVATSAEPTGETTGTVTGDLTILGVTQPVTLDVTLNKRGEYPFGNNFVMGISARTTVTRSDYGMTYAVDNGWVGDDIEVIIEVEAIRE